MNKLLRAMTKPKIAIPLTIILTLIMVGVIVESFIHNDSEKPEDSDVIVVLGGGDQGRMKRAADLYESSYAEKVIVTPVGDRYNTEELTNIARHYGIEEEDIIVDSESTSTYTNAQRTIEIMDENDFELAMIVTSDYHVKRAKIIFDRLNDGSKSFTYIAAGNLEGDIWIDREDAIRHWLSESIKVWGYRFGLYKFFG
ncbi:YdcF family protein [Jeotgalicoccus sp. ATCC 8456]|uniref:YdcF family protein n=1 Tax=Jeotgalicoccus sp. ATCC 8456 TaxID=946435 RepID=UPI0018E61339|nr:YdcF family protein [Jeotgalicoccus sp. ATCC 8456]QQD85647.1 YdcF family protein [Jeotgalicoccus sp. ATCC 8456]